MDNKIKIFLAGVGGLALLIILLVMIRPGQAPVEAGKYDAFAQCLADEGAIFYGAFWCPYCNRQKDMFGSSARALPYFECSTLDGRNQILACTEKEVKSYPTWDFADGSRLSGLLSLDALAEKTGCALPEDGSPSTDVSGGASDAGTAPEN
jgi:hypothetical protein